ncbi:MAG: ROK family protein [Anaerolineae bacterium]|nr:ROK family protein [Anaerolineae bacterium]
MSFRLALDIGSNKSTVALVESAAPEIVAHERIDTATLINQEGEPGANIAASLRRFLDTRRVDPAELLGVGIGIPGVVERSTGRVVNCPNLAELNGIELGSLLAADLGVGVFLENDSNLIALGEHEAGLGRGIDHLALVSVGSGLGCGLILDGKLYHGAYGAAGELGHTIIVPDGLLCACGAHGCLEMYASAKALDRVARELQGQGAAPNHAAANGAQWLIERARGGDEEAQAALTEAFRYLGLGLVSLVNLLNPQLVILEGDIMLAWPEGAETVRDTIMREALTSARQDLQIEMSRMAPYGAVLGGAALVNRMTQPNRG